MTGVARGGGCGRSGPHPSLPSHELLFCERWMRGSGGCAGAGGCAGRADGRRAQSTSRRAVSTSVMSTSIQPPSAAARIASTFRAPPAIPMVRGIARSCALEMPMTRSSSSLSTRAPSASKKCRQTSPTAPEFAQRILVLLRDRVTRRLEERRRPQASDADECDREAVPRRRDLAHVRVLEQSIPHRFARDDSGRRKVAGLRSGDAGEPVGEVRRLDLHAGIADTAEELHRAPGEARALRGHRIHHREQRGRPRRDADVVLLGQRRLEVGGARAAEGREQGVVVVGARRCRLPRRRRRRGRSGRGWRPRVASARPAA